MNQALIARRSSRGFTLLELMVVIVIIGVLAALIAPKILMAQNAVLAATRAQMKKPVQRELMRGL